MLTTLSLQSCGVRVFVSLRTLYSALRHAYEFFHSERRARIPLHLPVRLFQTLLLPKVALMATHAVVSYLARLQQAES